MNERNLGSVVRELRVKRGLNQAELAEAPGVDMDAGNISRFERGEQGIQQKKLEAIANKLQVPLSEIYAIVEGKKIESPAGTYNTEVGPNLGRSLPLVSWVRAGSWDAVVDPFEPGIADDWVTATRRMGKRSYALRVRGDSMVDPSGNGPSFPDGAIICVDPEVQPQHRDYVVVRIESNKEATFKQLVDEGGQRYLKPLNPRYPIMPITEDATFCGVVRQMVMDF